MASASSDSMLLKPASAEQIRRTWENAYDEWGKGAMSTDDFYARERLLAAQDFAKQGLTVWAAVPASAPDTLELLAHLEAFERPAVVRQPDEQGVHAVSCFSIGTVFCPRERRGNGHASALLKAIVTELRTRGALSNLYSDIGTELYSRYGWRLDSPVTVELPVPDQVPGQ
ncbi:hypothetical protein GGI12_005872, partial [Dipsacomyces acuminosporus]